MLNLGKRAQRIALVISAAALVLGALFLSPPIRVRADSWDFTSSNGGWVVYSPVYDGTPGTWSNGVGWVNGDFRVPDQNNRYRGVFIKKTLSPVAATVTAFSVTYDLSGLATNSSSSGAATIYINGSAVTNITFASQTNGTNKTISWSGSVSNVSTIEIRIASSYYSFTNSYAGSVTVKNASITATYPTATPTNTPTPTYTPTPGVLEPAGIPYPTCPILGMDKARFANGLAGWFRDGTPYQYDTANALSVYIPSGNSVYSSVPLNPSTQYIVDVRFRSASPATDQIFNVKVGSTTLDIPIPQAPAYPTLYRSSYQSTAANFPPGEGGSYALEISRPNSTSIDFIVDYICVRAVTQSSAPAVIPAQNTSSDACANCRDPVDLFDWKGMIEWIVCQIVRFFTCFIGVLIQRIALFVISIAAAIITFFKFFYDLIGGVISFVLDSSGTIARFTQGIGNNLGTGMVNAFHSSGAANTFNQVSRGIQDLPTLFNNFFGDVGTTVSGAFSSGANLFDVIGALISLTVKGIGFVIGLIPLILSSLTAGFNSGSVSMSGALITCSAPTDLWFYPCVGFYILDNTIFTGPAVYIVPIIIGLWSFETLLWAQEKIRGAFSSG